MFSFVEDGIIDLSSLLHRYWDPTVGSSRQSAHPCPPDFGFDPVIDFHH